MNVKHMKNIHRVFHFRIMEWLGLVVGVGGRMRQVFVVADMGRNRSDSDQYPSQGQWPELDRDLE